MLDKSLPYYNVIMKCTKVGIESVDQIVLPDGFRYQKYTPGDIEKWAEIEVAVGEFSNKEKAIAYFAKTYLPFEEQLRNRCYFIVEKMIAMLRLQLLGIIMTLINVKQP